ncbi:MAG: hypothetical protein ACFFKA_08315 [Candidatus Thorarchaeota archaeon]
MKNLKRNESNFFNLLELYVISKNLSNEILLDEYIQSRGTYYSYLSEHYAQTKRRVKIKLLLTKLFYSVVFGILPIIPLFAYFEFMNLLTSGSYEFEIIIFATSLLLMGGFPSDETKQNSTHANCSEAIL